MHFCVAVLAVKRKVGSFVCEEISEFRNVELIVCVDVFRIEIDLFEYIL